MPSPTGPASEPTRDRPAALPGAVRAPLPPLDVTEVVDGVVDGAAGPGPAAGTRAATRRGSRAARTPRAPSDVGSFTAATGLAFGVGRGTARPAEAAPADAELCGPALPPGALLERQRVLGLLAALRTEVARGMSGVPGDTVSGDPSQAAPGATPGATAGLGAQGGQASQSALATLATLTVLDRLAGQILGEDVPLGDGVGAPIDAPIDALAPEQRRAVREIRDRVLEIPYEEWVLTDSGLSVEVGGGQAVRWRQEGGYSDRTFDAETKRMRARLVACAPYDLLVLLTIILGEDPQQVALATAAETRPRHVAPPAAVCPACAVVSGARIDQGTPATILPTTHACAACGVSVAGALDQMERAYHADYYDRQPLPTAWGATPGLVRRALQALWCHERGATMAAYYDERGQLLTRENRAFLGLPALPEPGPR